MRLERVIDFCRALGDPARLRIVHRLARGSARGVEVAEYLSLTPATISHHMARLREAGIVRESREGNSILYSLSDEGIGEGIDSITAFIGEAKSRTEAGIGMGDAYAGQMEREVKAFLEPDGRLRHLPARYRKKLMVLEHMIGVFEPGRKYPEEDVNLKIMGFHEDYTTIRREFVNNRFMYRENGIYELNPREMWMDWRKLG